MPRSDGWVGIETSGNHASVALGAAGGEVLEEVITGVRQHAREVVPAMARLLNRAGSGPEDVRGIVISDGPGSFTGLRIGATVAKALAHVYHLPLRTASSGPPIGTSSGRNRAFGGPLLNFPPPSVQPTELTLASVALL
jgi:tRNA threonylcarbamoyladenosine biosynthesis protein TsaB